MDEMVSKIELQTFHSISEQLATVSSGNYLEMPAATPTTLTVPPVWLGTPVPPTDVLQNEALSVLRANIKGIRQSVADKSGTETTKTIVTEAIEKLFSGELPGPNSVEDFVIQLNGTAQYWAERVLQEGTPFSPVERKVAKPRHRKLFVLTAGGPGSQVFRNLRDAVSDQTLQVEGREHSGTDTLCIEDEWGVCASEFPEIVGLLKEFRSLSFEQQAMLCTACAPEDLRNFFPELAQDHDRQKRLLASALTFEIITRSGAQNYTFQGVIVAKGYQPMLDALRLDQTMAASVASKVEECISNAGTSTAITKLNSAKKQPSTFVPKEFVKLFAEGIEDAIAELNGHATVVTS